MRLLALALAAAFAVSACSDAGPTPSPQKGETGKGTPKTSTAGDGLRFVDVTEASGVALFNVSGDAKAKLAIPENIGQGAAALDYDGDGLLDLFIANGDVFAGDPGHPTRCALYRNLGSFKFEDVTEKAGLVFEAWCHGANVVDFDGDGHPDLYVTIYRGKNRFFRNTGKGSFEDATERFGGADEGPSTCSAFFDADQDGDLDLYVGNYVEYDPKNPPNDGNPCDWKGLSVSCGPRGTIPGKDTFYENRDGHLVEATAAFGFTGRPSYALGAVTADFDGDGDTDLYIANDSLANYLYVNLGNGKFAERAIEACVAMSEDGTPQAGMGVEAADIDNDGHPDIFVTNFSHDTNTLYQNIGGEKDEPVFRDGTVRMGLGNASFTFLSWGTSATDLDSDGWLDLVVASGHVYPQVDTAKNLDTSYAQRNQLFHNRGQAGGGLEFEDVAETTPGFQKKGVSRGLVSADFDNDGDRDLFFVELDATPTLLRNDSKQGHWVSIALIGKGKNRDAIGAKVTVVDSTGRRQLRERSSGGSYLSSNDPRLAVGLGAASGPVTFEVRWPDGSIERHERQTVDQHYVVTEGGGIKSVAR